MDMKAAGRAAAVGTDVPTTPSPALKNSPTGST